MTRINWEMHPNLQIRMQHIIRQLSQRREQLSMSDYHIAQRSRVSQPTVYRVLSGQNPRASFENVMAIADAMGMSLVTKPLESIGEFREKQAERKAGMIVKMTQATSAMEGQGLDPLAYVDTKAQIKQKLLAGPAKDLWAE